MRNFHDNTIHIAKISLTIKNMESSLRFYTEDLGFQILNQNDEFVSLTVNQKDEILRLYENKAAKELDSSLGIYHFAILLPQRKDLGKFLHHLIERQIPISGAADHLVSEAIYLQDPDGIGIEISADKDETTWKMSNSSIVMATDPFDYSGVYYEDGSFEVFTKLPAETKIGHLHLEVKDLQKETFFYHDMVGFQITSKDFQGAVFLSDQHYHHHLALNSWGSRKKKAQDKDAIGLRDFTIEFPMCEALVSALEKVKKEGIQTEESIRGYYLKDFENYQMYFDIRHNVI